MRLTSIFGGGDRGGGRGWRIGTNNLVLTSLVVSLIVLFGSKGADGAAVMSVDLGSEWMKIGIVSVSCLLIF